jgi:NADH:ubiquinone oxidoreductase subunit E
MLAEKYPDDLAQRQDGYVTKAAMEDIARMLDITSTEVAEVVGFYTLYHDKPAGKYRMQVCTDLPCALRGADKFMQELCANLGIQVGETTTNGLITIEAVTCLAGCDRAPLFQVQSRDGLAYHENMSLDKTMELVETLKKSDKEVK